MEEYIDTHALAELAGVSRDTVVSDINRGILPAEKREDSRGARWGGCWFIRADDAEKYIPTRKEEGPGRSGISALELGRRTGQTDETIIEAIKRGELSAHKANNSKRARWCILEEDAREYSERMGWTYSAEDQLNGHSQVSVVLDGYKQCSKCRSIFPATLEFFNPNPRYKKGLHSWCKKCMGEYQRNRHLKKYNDVPENNEDVQGSELGAIQPIIDPSDRCNACGSARNVAGHLYKGSRDIRGYLCTRCQRIVDEAQEDIDRINKVSTYLKRTQLDKAPSGML